MTALDPVEEALYRLRLASEHLKRAELALRARDWPMAVHFSQLAAENAAKAIIAVFEAPARTHDPSEQLLGRYMMRSMPRSALARPGGRSVWRDGRSMNS